MTPFVEVSLNGNPLGNVQKRALSGSIDEYDGEKADRLTLEISNYDGKLQKPRRGETISVTIGWKETGVIKAGQFVVTGVEKRLPVAIFHVTADSVDLKKSLKEQKSRNWQKDKTLKDVFEDIAKDNQLSPSVDQDIGSTKIEKLIAQTGESDMHLCMRLGRQYGALVKFKDGRLIVVKRGKGTTASGGAADRAVVTPNDVVAGGFMDSDRPARSAAKGVHYDRASAKRTVEKSSGGLSIDGAPDFGLPHLYGTQGEAKNHADSRKRQFDRDGRAMRLELGAGRVGVAPGGIIATQGFSDDDDQDWPVKTRRFAFSPNALAVHVEGNQKDEG